MKLGIHPHANRSGEKRSERVVRLFLGGLGCGLVGFELVPAHAEGLLMCSDTVIEVQALSKRYEVYAQPRDRFTSDDNAPGSDACLG